MTTLKTAETITHKFTGERITFLETSTNTDGAYEYIEVFLPPGCEGPPLHYHMKFEEEFEVMEGELKVVRGDEGHILQAGEQIAVPKETNHMFINASNQKPVTFRVKITPSHHFEDSMRILYGLMRDGKTDNKGIPKDKVHLALALDMQDSRMVELPFFLRYLMNRLVKKGKKKGIDQELIEKYAR